MPADLPDLAWNWLLIRASGVTAWGLLTAVVVWGLVLATVLRPPREQAPRLLHMHRWLGALALAFTAVHMGLLLIDPVEPFTPVQILVPLTAPWEPVAVALGSVALWLLIPASVVGRLRSRMGRAGAVWFRRSHWLAYAAWPVATAHYVLAGTDALAEWSIGLIIAGTAAVVAALVVRGVGWPLARACAATPAAVTPAAPSPSAVPGRARRRACRGSEPSA